ncbi:hypothetical protein BDK51DRAFT_31859, partial [Blyttiomyces helicus]
KKKESEPVASEAAGAAKPEDEEEKLEQDYLKMEQRIKIAVVSNGTSTPHQFYPLTPLAYIATPNHRFPFHHLVVKGRGASCVPFLLNARNGDFRLPGYYLKLHAGASKCQKDMDQKPNFNPEEGLCNLLSWSERGANNAKVIGSIPVSSPSLPIMQIRNPNALRLSLLTEHPPQGDS